MADIKKIRSKTAGVTYDIKEVRGELFGNAGTGDFVIGPDK